MSRMFACRTAVLAIALAPFATQAAGGGNCTYENQKLAIIDGVIFQEPDSSDENAKKTVVALASVKLDAGRVAAATDPAGAVTDQVSGQFHGQRDGGGIGLIRITVDEHKIVTGYYAYFAPGSNLSRSGSGPFGELTLTRNDARGAAGHYTLKSADDEVACDVTFDLAYARPGAAASPVAAAAAKGGKPLPAGGGEIGKVFQANVTAMQKGDVDAMIATASKDQAAQMRAQRQEPDFPQMLALMQAFAPRSVTVTGGQDFGDHAELTLEGIDQGGGKSTGTAQMVKENGQWRVQKTSMKSGGG